eukprot:3472408-Pyramimonas_sp.AAC.2
MWRSHHRRVHSSQKRARVSRMEGGSFSKRDSRLNAAHPRHKSLKITDGGRLLLQNVVLAVAPCTVVL